MGICVELSKIIEAMEFQGLDGSSYFDKTNAETATFTTEEFQAADNGDSLDDYPEWQHDNLELARKVLAQENNEDKSDNRFIGLPTKFDIDEYRIMEKYCFSVGDEKIAEVLYRAIKGSGAFRRFKDSVHQLDVAEDWYQYRDETIKRMAIEWCEQNGIAYVDDLTNRGQQTTNQEDSN
jgi:hypothetical protein